MSSSIPSGTAAAAALTSSECIATAATASVGNSNELASNITMPPHSDGIDAQRSTPVDDPTPFSRPLRISTHIAGVRHHQQHRGGKAAATTAAGAAAARSAPAASVMSSSGERISGVPESDPWELRPGQLLVAEREPHNPRDPHAITLAKTPWIDQTAAAAPNIEEITKIDETTSSETSSTPTIPVSAAAAAAVVAPPLESRPLGHLPATLARFLSPLLLRGLITIEVRVEDPNASDSPATAAAATVDIDANDNAGSAEAEKENDHSAATAANTPQKKLPSRVDSTPVKATQKRASVEKIHVRVDIIPVTAVADAGRPAIVADTASCALWSELVSFIDSFSSSSHLSSSQRMVSNFSLVVLGVLDRFSGLFSPSESAALRELLAKPPQAQALFVRLSSRTRPHRWFQLSALKYELDDITQGVQQLSVDEGFDAAANDSAALLPAALPLADSSEPPFARSASAPAFSLMQQQENVKFEEDAQMDDDSIPSVAAAFAPASIASTAFLSRSSYLSMDVWAAALPSILHECTLSTIKEVIAVLGLTKLLASVSGSSLKQSLIVHLTKQRTLFASSMLRCENTRKLIHAVCGDFVQLRPDFLLLCQRIHRLFFLSEDPSADASAMLLEHMGVSRFHKTASAALQQTAPATTAAIKREEDVSMEAASSAVAFASSVSAAASSAAASSSAAAAVASDVASPTPATAVWSLFPTRECFLAYDLAVQFLLQMHEVCEGVLATGEARRADQTYSADQALAMLSEAQTRLDMEILEPGCTHMLDAFALSPNTVSHAGKPRNAATFSSLFGRAQSSPIDSVASASSASSPAAGASSPPPSSLTAAPFRPCDPLSSAAAAFFDLSVRDAAHSFARPFRAGWVYASACHYGARVLEKEKRYVDANTLYARLLQTPFAVHRRGQWWNRWVLNLESHVRDRAEAYRVALLALKDPSVRTGDRHELHVRTVKLWRHKDGGKGRRPCPVPGGETLPDFGRVRAVQDMMPRSAKDTPKKQGATRNNFATTTPDLKPMQSQAAAAAASSPSPRKEALLYDSGYSSTLTSEGVRLTTVQAASFGHMDGDHSRFFDPRDDRSCRVEDLALAYYAREEFGAYTGLHDEGKVFRALFALLMFEVIFAEVPDVFHTQYHDAPLDLLSDSFYPTRAGLIHKTLSSIRGCPCLRTLVSDSWHAHHGVRVRGLNWRSTDLSLQQLQDIAECMGGEALAFVCDTLARDYAGWSGGLPDLFLWKTGAKPMEPSASSNSTVTNIQRNSDSVEINLVSDDDEELGEQKQDSSAPHAGAASSACLVLSSPSPAALPSSMPSPDPPVRAGVICISSDDDGNSDAENLPCSRRKLDMSTAAALAVTGGKSLPPSTPQQPAAHRSALPPASAPASLKPVRKRATSTTSASAGKSDSSNKRAKHASPSPAAAVASTVAAAVARSGSVQQSLLGFASVSPRFVTPTPAASSFRTFSSPQPKRQDSSANRSRSDFASPSARSSIPSSVAAASSASAAFSASPSSAVSSSSVASSRSPPCWPSFKLVEVKGPGDRCSPQQVAWIAQLAKCAACTVEVCYVLLPDQANKLK